MKYLKIGSGPKNLIVVPGLSLKSPIKAEKRLTKRYGIFENHTVYILDIREDYKECPTLEAYADKIAELAKKEGISNADIFGVSMGGMISQALAARHPQLVNKLVLGSSAARHNDTSREIMRKWLAFAAEGDIEVLVNDTLESIISPQTLKYCRTAFLRGLSDISPSELEEYSSMIHAAATFELYDHLDLIKCPVFVIGCEGDKVFTATGSTELSEKLHCPLYIYGTEFGHGAYDEAPDYLKRVKSFLDEA